MKSRITIEVDFNNNNQPVIQILSQKSNDLRDALIQNFLQSLQHSSRWCRIVYCGNHTAPSYTAENGVSEIQRWTIEPLTPADLSDEMPLMRSVLENSMVKAG